MHSVAKAVGVARSSFSYHVECVFAGKCNTTQKAPPRLLLSSWKRWQSYNCSSSIEIC